VYNIKRISIIIIVVVAVALVASSFVGEDINGRAIIIGLGVDVGSEGVKVTAEIVSPASSGEQVGAFSKTISAEGKSIAMAISRIAEFTGKEASLGRCLLIVFGQEYYENTDLSNDIEYFIRSDSFKESSSICCCKGSAEDLFNNSAAMSQGVSLALSAMFGTQSKQTAVVTNTLLDYTLSQRSLLKTGFMNRVEFVPSDNENPTEPDRPQGYFDLRNIVIFAENKYVCSLTDEEIRGFGLMNRDVIGSSFVSNASGEQMTVTVNSKDIKLDLQSDDTIKCQINLLGKVVRTDSGEVEGQFVAQSVKELPQEVIDDVVSQATAQINAILEKQNRYNFDIVNLHETFRRKKGTSDELCALPTEQIAVQLEVKFAEK